MERHDSLAATELCAEAAAPEVSGAMAQIVGSAVARTWYQAPSGEYHARNYIADQLGSNHAVVNEQGVPIETRDHYPCGLMMPGRAYVQAQETRQGYTGHELDAETAMYYAGARYYMQALGRWTAVDSLADAFQAWSPYNYVMGNPVYLIDPDGRAGTDQEAQTPAYLQQRELSSSAGVVGFSASSIVRGAFATRLWRGRICNTPCAFGFSLLGGAVGTILGREMADFIFDAPIRPPCCPTDLALVRVFLVIHLNRPLLIY